MLSVPEFMKRIRARRKAGESLASIGKSFGVSRQTVWQWLKGITSPNGSARLLADRDK